MVLKRWVFCQHHTVFHDHIMPGMHQIRGGLSLRSIGIKIGGDGPRTLVLYQLPAVCRFSCHLITGRRTEYHRRPRHGMIRTWRHRHPQILTDLYGHRQLRKLIAGKDLFGAKGNFPVHKRKTMCPATLLTHGSSLPCRIPAGKMSSLIKFGIGGNMAFGNQPQYLPMKYYCRHIIKPSEMQQRKPHTK